MTLLLGKRSIFIPYILKSQINLVDYISVCEKKLELYPEIILACLFFEKKYHEIIF